MQGIGSGAGADASRWRGSCIGHPAPTRALLHCSNLIFEASSSAVLYGSKSADLTDKILDLYNSTHAVKKKK